MFYTSKQAAERLGMSVLALRRYVRQGAIKAGKRPGQTILMFSDKQIRDAERLIEGDDSDAVSEKNDIVGAGR